jgi:hypothetical protein
MESRLEDFRKKHCKGYPFNAHKIGKQPTSVALNHAPKIEDFKRYFANLPPLPNDFKRVPFCLAY